MDVPLGPNVFTKTRSSQTARSTSDLVASTKRRPIESAAALMIWAWAPHRIPAMPAGPRSAAGSASR